MTFSIIIPTYNRLDELKELIPSIEAQDFIKDNIEIVIIDDGSTDGTREYIDTLGSPVHIIYYLQENQGPGPARNKGMAMATGDIFIFVDSDCLLPSQYLRQIVQSQEMHDYDAFGGPDTYHPSFSPLLKAINYSMTSFIGTGGTRGSTKSIAKYYPRSFNMGLKRAVYEGIGEFNDLRHGQDMDYSARIYEAGFKVGLIPTAYVYHKRRTSFWRFFKQIHNWGVTRINLASLHPEMLKPVHLAPAFLVLSSLLFTLLSIFIYRSPLILIVGAMILCLIYIFILVQSYLEYKSMQVALLSIVTLTIQIVAYAIGTLNGIWQKRILRKHTAIGITKNYYK